MGLDNKGKPYYITTAIAYTSGKPHIGNSYEIVKAVGAFEKDQNLLSISLPILIEIFSSALRIKYHAEEDNTFRASTVLAEKTSKNSLLRYLSKSFETALSRKSSGTKSR